MINVESLLDACNIKPKDEGAKTARRRIETVFFQLCDQMMLKGNYAKTFAGLQARMITTIASVTLRQYMNWKNNKRVNHITYALAA